MWRWLVVSSHYRVESGSLKPEGGRRRSNSEQRITNNLSCSQGLSWYDVGVVVGLVCDSPGVVRAVDSLG